MLSFGGGWRNKNEKEDLRTGMVVKLQEGTKYMVLKNTPCGDCLVKQPNGYISLDNYTGDLRDTHASSLSVEEIYYPTSMYTLKEEDWEDMELIFTNNKKQMTIEEIERELGYAIEIVGAKK